MKRILFLAVAVIAALTATAQDLIVTRNGQRIDAKIIEVSSTEIRYKEWTNQEGPTFVLRSDELNTIIYQNGTVKTFDHSSATPTNYNSSVTYTGTSAAASSIPYGMITKDDNDIYVLGNKRMSESEYVDFIRQNCKEAYDYYDSGVSLWNGGWKLFGLGVGFTLGGAIWYCVGMYCFDPWETSWKALVYGGYTLMGLGGLATTGSVPCLIVGGIRKNNSHNIYNEQCAKQQMAVEFGIQPSPGGLGLAIKF